MAERVIISGEAGETWTNDTDRVRYQFIAALNNTCGVCLQYHLKISAAWPIPIHYNCRCIQRQIKPGAKAPQPFCDYRKLLDAMNPADQAAAIGASNYRLLKSGLAKWEDIVTPNRVRDFREVVARKRLIVDQMVKHGVKRYQAEKAYADVHTTEHERVARERAELLSKLTGAGLAQEKIVGELASRLAARVTVAAGPTGAQVGRPQDVGGPAWSGGKLPGAGASSAGELAKLVSGWKPPKPPVKPRPPAAIPAVPEAPKPPPARPIEEPVVVQHAEPERPGEVIPPKPDVIATSLPAPAAGPTAATDKPPPPARTKKERPPSDIAYVRAPAGGATSDVNGKHYKGGQLMPVHGLSPPKAPTNGSPNGAGSGPAKAKETATPKTPRVPREPKTAEQIAKENADREHWAEVKSGPLGEVYRLGEHPHPVDRTPDLKKWEQWVEATNGQQLASVTATAEDIFVRNTIAATKEWERRGLTDEQLRESLLENLRLYTEEYLAKKHVKQFPGSPEALSAVRAAVLSKESTSGQIADLRRINQAMEPKP